VLDAADVLVHRRPLGGLGGSNACASSFGERKRRKYHDESTKVSIVSVSRVTGAPVSGWVVFTQSVAAPRGDEPFGRRSRPSASGSSTGSWSCGTANSPPSASCRIGMGVPQ